ncbi:MAG: hypothetical protein ACTSPX_06110, partial [Candidatus Thorarchaeota archaeon]
ETGDDTGVFEAKIYVDIAAVTDDAVADLDIDDDELTFEVAPDEAVDVTFTVTYFDDYHPNPLASDTRSVDFGIATEVAIIEFDRATYTEDQLQIARIEITEPDCNDQTGSIEILIIDPDSTQTAEDNDPEVSSVGIDKDGDGDLDDATDVVVGLIEFRVTTEYVTNQPQNISTLFNGTKFTETAKDSGVFRSQAMNLTELPDIAGVDFEDVSSVRVIYTDIFDDEEVYDTANTQVGVVTGVLSLDRTEYPAPYDEAVEVTVTLEDDDENVDPVSEDTVDVVLTITDGRGVTLWFNNIADELTLTLEETGVNTGVFEGTFTYELNASGDVLTVANSATYSLYDNDTGEEIPLQYMMNAKLTVTYEPDDIDISRYVKPHTGVLALDKTSLNIGEVVEITLTEPDLNLQTDENDTVPVLLIDEDGNDITVYDSDGAPANLTLTETGENTGVFTATLQVGVRGTAGGVEDPDDIVADFAVVYDPSETVFDPGVTEFDLGDTITIRYEDEITAMTYWGSPELVDEDIDQDITMIAHTATLSLDKDTYGPFSFFTVTLYDPDLKLNEEDEVWLKLIRITESGDSLDESTLEDFAADITDARDPESEHGYDELDVEAYGNGTITWTFRLWIDADFTDDDADEEVDDDDGVLAVEPVDTLTVFYVDPQNAAGESQTIRATATITSATGTIEFDKSSYLVGERMTVTVTDID